MPTSVRHEMVFRPRPAPARGVPLGVRSVGLHQVDPPWSERHEPRPILEIMWCDQGAGEILVGRSFQRLGAGEAVILLPGMEHVYRATRSGWRWHWVTCDGPLAATLMPSCGLESAIYRVGTPPHEELRSLAHAISDPAHEHRAGALAYGLVMELAARVAPSAPLADDALVRRALDLLHRRWNEATFGVAATARHLGVHRSHLSRRFTVAIGMPPQAYLLRLRLDAAQALLAGGSLPIGVVAQQCGFARASYFARVLRQHTGYGPREVRRGGQEPGGAAR
jgi:AraC family transcriptional regulator, arabinose operon regulatory protein